MVRHRAETTCFDPHAAAHISKSPWSTCSRKFNYASPVRLGGRRYGPITHPSRNPVHMLKPGVAESNGVRSTRVLISGRFKRELWCFGCSGETVRFRTKTKTKRRLVRRSASASYDRMANAPPRVIYAWRRYLDTKRTSPPPEGAHQDTPERAGQAQLPKTSVRPTTGVVVY